MTIYARGIDIYHAEGTIDWPAVLKDGYSFAFAKATEGVSNVDSMFATNWKAMHEVGITAGCYHFFHPDQDGAAQAHHLLAQVTLSKHDLPIVVDVETGPFTDTSRTRLAACLNVLEKATNKVPIIYTGPSFWNEQVKWNAGRYPLWIAHYGVRKPRIPMGWTDWAFWQYLEGGNGATYDTNKYRGTHADLIKRFRLA